MTTNARQRSKTTRDSASKTTASPKTSTPTGQQTVWKGEEVEDGQRNADSAEARAARAEGNTPVLVSVAAQEARADESRGTQPEETNEEPSASTAADDEEIAEEKRIAAAEEHAAALSHHHPRGSL
jgi:hypothetical protein